ncbi:MAG: choice-of-anchor Q domain-containing protein [Prolixibacteraceae bacterium]
MKQVFNQLVLVLFLIIASFEGFSNPVYPDNIIFVSTTGSGNQDGTSWGNSLSSIQLAVELASSVDPVPSVWVAAGTYYGDTTEENAFTMIEGVNVYGSFIGNEPADYNLTQRKIQVNPTILDGKNVQRVLVQNENFTVSPFTFWDGFIITNGFTSADNIEGQGAGAFLKAFGILKNCSIHHNRTTGYRAHGGGIVAEHSYLLNCLIYENSTEGSYAYGGGVYSSLGMLLSSCNVVKNSSISDNVLGAGVYSENGELINTILWGNKANGRPAQFYDIRESVIEYCAIEGGFQGKGNITLSSANEGEQGGNSVRFNAVEDNDFTLMEGSACINSGDPNMEESGLMATDAFGNIRIQGNRIDIGAYESSSSFQVHPDENNILYVTPSGGGILDGSSWTNALSSVQVALNAAATLNTFPRIWVASGTYFGDTSNVNAFTMVEGVSVYGSFIGNEVSDYDLSKRNFQANPTILDGQNVQRVLYQLAEYTDSTQSIWDGFIITNGKTTADNEAGEGAGAFLQRNGNLLNCAVYNNETTGYRAYGGGISANAAQLVNCLIYNNTTTGKYASGGGIYTKSETEINNCTIVKNHTDSDYYLGGGIYAYSYPKTVKILNSIVWGNTSDDTPAQFRLGYDTDINFCAVEGGYPGVGNVSVSTSNAGTQGGSYVLFNNPDSNDFTLLEGSACINSGEISLNIDADISTDYYGNERVQGDKIDIGAYESSSSFSIQSDENNILYVTQAGRGIQNGSSWANALSSVQVALNAASTLSSTTSIWVASGTYVGDTSNVNAFTMAEGINVYGSFVGNEAADYDLSKRNFQANPTILDGQKAQRVLYQMAEYANSSQSVWDGFIITNGKTTADSEAGEGAGAFLQRNGMLMNCAVYNNETTGYRAYGAGVSAIGAQLVNCLIYNNTTTGKYASGGGIYAKSETEINNCTIVKNHTDSDYYGGGGIYTYSYPKPVKLVNSIFWGNTSADQSSQLRESEDTEISYCAFEGEQNGESNIYLEADNNGSNTDLNYVCFLNPIGNNFNLHATSACIDAGNSAAVSILNDYSGNARIYGTQVDMGAFEYDGNYSLMDSYTQSICSGTNTETVKFDQLFSGVSWTIHATPDNISGFVLSGSDSIPTMLLQNTSTTVDTLVYVITPYFGTEALGQFNYNFEVLPSAPIDNVTGTYPSQSQVINKKQLLLRWDEVANADEYEVFVWKVNELPAETPISITTKNSFSLSDLENNQNYSWKIIASNNCTQSTSPVYEFSIEIIPELYFSNNETCYLGALVDEQTSTVEYITGIELQDEITFSIIGDGAESFSIERGSTFESKEGGSVTIHFTPAEFKDSFYASIVASSANHTDTLNLKGIITNYYLFNVDMNLERFSSGESIPITGTLITTNGNPVANKEIEIYVIAMNYRRTIMVVTEEDGSFTGIFTPNASESGHYTVGACLPGSSASEEMDHFDILGMSLSNSTKPKWLVQLDESISGKLEIKNKSAVPLTNIVVEPVQLANGCLVNFEPIAQLEAFETAQLHYMVEGTVLTAGNYYEECSFQIISDENIFLNFSTFFYCEPYSGEINVLPKTIHAFMSKGNQRAIYLTVYNNGNKATGPINVSLPVVDWMTLAGNAALPSIAVGDSVLVPIWLSPKEDTPMNVPFTGTIAVNSESGSSTSIPFVIEATSEQTGSLLVDVVDEYFYNTTAHTHLSGAQVTVKHPYSQEIIVSGTTGVDGVVAFDDLPEGNYLLVVRSDKHSEYQEYITIEPSQTLNKFVFVQFQAITFTWDVIRTEIEDEYTFDLIIEFETNVPAPVVTLELSEQLPELETIGSDDVVNFYLVASNHGLISANDFRVLMPVIEGFSLKPLFDYIDSIPAHTTQIIPATLTRTSSLKSVQAGGTCTNIGAKFEYECGGSKSGSAGTKPLWSSSCGGGSGDLFTPYGGGGSRGGTASETGTGGGGSSSKSRTGCNPCLDAMGEAVVNCTLDLVGAATGQGTAISIAQCIKAAWDALGGSFEDYAKAAISCGEGFIPSYSCVTSTRKYMTCVKGAGKSPNEESSNPSEALLKSLILNDDELVVQAFEDHIQFLNFMKYRLMLIDEYTGNVNLNEREGFEDFYSQINFSFVLEEAIDESVLEDITVTDISLTEMAQVITRWNRTLNAREAGIYIPNDNYPNIVDQSILDVYVDSIGQVVNYMTERGFDSLEEMFLASNEVIQWEMNKEQTGVCARVTLLISQTMTMTREAFEGTFIINNGNENEPITDFLMNIEITDEQGNNANDLFQIDTLSLNKIMAVDGSGIVEPNESGRVVFQFIPTKEAAPDAAKTYYFGGSFSYTDPFIGLNAEIDLYPVQLMVSPSPDLQVDYFMERDIFGDDALTTERVEPIIPAALGVMINNKGAGLAKNVLLETAQPKIIENEKGLLIDFKIIGSSLNGEEVQLGSEKIAFGDIDAHTASVGVWWMTSTLLGHFVDYKSNLVHENSYGNPNLSLVSRLTLHELIHSVEGYGNKADGISDFLVNDVSDIYHLPDSLYFSDGSRTGVYPANTISYDHQLRKGDSTVQLTVDPSQRGWNYALTDDPGNGGFELTRILRNADQQEIPICNVWLTYCTLTTGADPIYENKIHFLDSFAIDQQQTYTLFFKEVPNRFEVESIDTIPVEFIKTPLKQVRVTFTEPIIESTFTYEDMVLTCQGISRMDSTLTVSKITDSSYLVDLSSLTQTSGFYTFVVNTLDVIDTSGVNGYYGKEVSWVQVLDSAIVRTDSVSDLSSVSAILNGSTYVYFTDDSIWFKGFKWRKLPTGAYNWIDVDGEFSSQLTGLIPKTNYEYFAFVASLVDTVYGEAIVFTTLENTWVANYSSELEIRLAPNPAKEYVDVIVENNPSNFGKLQLFRSTGEQVKNCLVEGEVTRINLSDISEGIYLLHYSNPAGMNKVIKLLKK